MIRALVNKDNEKLMSFLKRENSVNTFIVGDIENYGYETDFQKVWGEIDEGENFKGVLLKYYKSFIFYSMGECQFSKFAQIIKSYEHDVISGAKSSVERIKKYFNDYREKELYFAELTIPIKYIEKEKVECLKIEEIGSLLNLRKTIEEFSSIVVEPEALRLNLETKSGRIYCIKKDGKIVSSASTTAENSKSAMVVAVCTLNEYRNKGYATQCVEKLCNDVLLEGKTLCLFYNNPAAGKIYKRIGFRDIGKWIMLTSRR